MHKNVWINKRGDQRNPCTCPAVPMVAEQLQSQISLFELLYETLWDPGPASLRWFRKTLTRTSLAVKKKWLCMCEACISAIQTYLDDTDDDAEIIVTAPAHIFLLADTPRHVCGDAGSANILTPTTLSGVLRGGLLYLAQHFGGSVNKWHSIPELPAWATVFTDIGQNIFYIYIKYLITESCFSVLVANNNILMLVQINQVKILACIPCRNGGTRHHFSSLE